MTHLQIRHAMAQCEQANSGTVTFNLEVGRFLYGTLRRRLHEIATTLSINLTMAADKGLLTHWVTVRVSGQGKRLSTFLLFVEALIDANEDE